MADKEQDKQQAQAQQKPAQQQHSPNEPFGRGGGGDAANRVPTSGPLVQGEGADKGQNPYTDPPPMARRRFYEDPRPLNQATEEQVLQGRGAPPKYPPDDLNPSREWNPRRYPDQAQSQRPADSPQPTPTESMTVAELLRLPQGEQDRILQEARQGPPSGPPQYKPTSEYLAEEDKSEEQRQKIRDDRERERREGHRLAMAPASPGTTTAS
jgi:hypothetical protein